MAMELKRELAWITGAGGLIGNYLVEICAKATKRFHARGLTREDFPITDYSGVERLFRAEMPRLIIHCAAMSKSPLCEANPAEAKKVNIEATAFLAQLAEEIQLIFFSSDLVFDGQKGDYVETDSPNPLSVYSETKAEAEREVSKNPKHTIIRTSLNGGLSPRRDRGFNEEICLAWKAGKTLKLFTDEYRSPIHARETARAIWELADKNVSGIYHVAGAQKFSRWEIGDLVARRHPELNPRLLKSSRAEYNGPPRPPDTSLNCGKAQQILSFKLPGLTEWLEQNPAEPF